MKKSFFILSVLFVFLNVADVVLTQFALSSGKLGEANPILASNLNFLVPAKMAGIFLILVIAYLCEKKFNSDKALIAPSVLMGFVVVWNVIQIIKSGAI